MLLSNAHCVFQVWFIRRRDIVNGVKIHKRKQINCYELDVVFAEHEVNDYILKDS